MRLAAMRSAAGRTANRFTTQTTGPTAAPEWAARRQAPAGARIARP